jgi:hypothetical protein
LVLTNICQKSVRGTICPPHENMRWYKRTQATRKSFSWPPDDRNLFWRSGSVVGCVIRRKRGRIHAVLTGLLDLPANVQVNHAHAKRGRSCTLSPICISICPELSDGSNSKNAISYICFSMYFLADNAKVGFFLNLFVEVKIFSLWQELSKQCFRFALESAYYIFTEMRFLLNP